MEAMRSMPSGQTIVGEPERRGDERSEAPRSGGSPTIVRDAVPSPSTAPDPEVRAGHARRRFTTQYKLEILRKADACTRSGQLGALLRKEGLYSSQNEPASVPPGSGDGGLWDILSWNIPAGVLVQGTTNTVTLTQGAFSNQDYLSLVLMVISVPHATVQ